MNILMFDAAYPPPVIGGKEKQAHLLAKTLVKQGVNVEAISYIHNGNASSVVDGVKIHRMRKGFFSIFTLFQSLLKLKKKNHILHVHTPSRIGKLATLYGFFLGYKLVFKFPNEKHLDNQSFIQTFMWRIIFKIVDSFVILENDTFKKIREMNVSEDRLFKVFNGIEIENLDKVYKKNDQVNLIFVGRLEKQKSCDVLLNACALLRPNINYCLTIVGDGSLRVELNNLATRLALKNNIEFIGHVTNPLEHIKRADILILPSLHEGMSNVILEAISCGVPVIATRVGSSKEQVGDFGDAFLCPTLNEKCIAEKIQVLIDDDALREQYGRYLYSNAVNNFSIESIANLYLKKYKFILEV